MERVEARRRRAHAPEEPEKVPVRVMVIGVGNGGVNAVNRMAQFRLHGVQLVAVDTDAQVLARSRAAQQIQIGRELTEGRSTGGRPELGRKAAEGSREQLTDLMKNLDMVFLTTGLGGGTGTGAAPVIAELARAAKILTLAIVTLPFSFEGQARANRAAKGLENLKRNVDALIVIPNDKLLSLSPGTPLTKAFEIADEVLLRGVQGITDLVTSPGMINLSLADVDAVLRNAGPVMIGIGEAQGERRVREALEQAATSPLLERGTIYGASRVIINITGGPDLSLREVTDALSLVPKLTSTETDINFGTVIKENMTGQVRITVIATGLRSEPAEEELLPYEELPLTGTRPRREPPRRPRERREIKPEDLDIPAFLRRRRAMEEEEEEGEGEEGLEPEE